ncbi:uncharacterized protein LOC108097700 isoform X2 [Drosophila ficusphila]|uniref:uncharacterized protein LOC108097700 isoform X2 n=1 Tax=Drosophila ficusphila TaxID=30025 RepID=UPI0007E68356|nr:uncharacterized protein LOC108097700 isoform X2 [Drosophila ficusphila]
MCAGIGRTCSSSRRSRSSAASAGDRMRRRQAAELGVLLNKDNLTPHQHSLLQSLSQSHSQGHSHAHSTDSSQSGSKLERFLPNHFVEAQLNEVPCQVGGPGGGTGPVSGFDDNPLQVQMAAAAAAAAAAAVAVQKRHELQMANVGQLVPTEEDDDGEEPQRPAFKNHLHGMGHGHALGLGHNPMDEPGEAGDFEKDCNGALNMHHQNQNNNHDNNISMKSEPLSEGEFNPDDIQLMQTNYNGAQNYYSPVLDPNILHPDVIVDTDNLSDCSSSTTLKKKRKMSTSTDGDSTNYELIEYLKRREKRDEEFLKRMDAREDRLMNLLERTVVAIETLAVRRALSFPLNEIKPSAATAASVVVVSPPTEATSAATQEQSSSNSSEKKISAPASSIPVEDHDLAIEVPDDGDDEPQAMDTPVAVPPEAGEDDRSEGKQT